MEERRDREFRISIVREYYKSLPFLNFLLNALRTYNLFMERRIFWLVFIVLGLLADFLLPIWWGLAASIPIVFIAWWVAYRSDWF